MSAAVRLERVAVVGDLGGGVGVGPDDADDVEAGGVLQQPVGLEERQRQSGQLPLLGEVDRVGGEAGGGSPAGLDLDEHHGVSVPADEVNLPLRSAVAAEEDFHPGPAEVAGGETFEAAGGEVYDFTESTEINAAFYTSGPGYAARNM